MNIAELGFKGFGEDNSFLFSKEKKTKQNKKHHQQEKT